MISHGAASVRLLIVSCCIVSFTTSMFGQQGNGIVAQRVDRSTLFDPAHQKPITYKQGDITIELLVQHEMLSLEIRKPKVPTSHIRLPDNMVQVNAIHAGATNKVVVVGMFSGDVWSIAIVDLDVPRIGDNFICYEPAISPRGRYIAFIKFFPPHGAEGPEDHYMLYDVAKSAIENRPGGVSSADWKTVGVTVYPFGIGNKEFDNLHLTATSEHQFASTQFFWSASGQRLVFADSYKGQLRLILIDFQKQDQASVRFMEVTSTCGSRASESGGCPAVLSGVNFGKGPDQEMGFRFTGILQNVGYEHVFQFAPSDFSVVGFIQL
jgi:hypothetical protein